MCVGNGLRGTRTYGSLETDIKGNRLYSEDGKIIKPLEDRSEVLDRDKRVRYLLLYFWSLGVDKRSLVHHDHSPEPRHRKFRYRHRRIPTSFSPTHATNLVL